MLIEFWLIMLVFTKAVIYITSLLAVGSVIYAQLFDFNTRFTKQTNNSVIYVASFLALLSSILFILVQTGFLMDDGLTGMFDFEIMQIFFAGKSRYSIMSRIIGLILIVLSMIIRNKNNFITYLGVILVLLSFTLVGHAAGDQQVVTSFLLFIHLLAVSFWFGALPALYFTSKSSDATSLLSKFGYIASFVVPSLIIIGGAFAAILLGDISKLFTSEYGQSLIVKILIVAFLLSLATLNKVILVPNIRQNKPNARLQLKLSILVEFFAFILIFITTAYLTTSVNL